MITAKTPMMMPRAVKAEVGAGLRLSCRRAPSSAECRALLRLIAAVHSRAAVPTWPRSRLPRFRRPDRRRSLNLSFSSSRSLFGAFTALLIPPAGRRGRGASAQDASVPDDHDAPLAIRGNVGFMGHHDSGDPA